MAEKEIFNPEKLEKLNNPVRKQWIPPQKIVEALQLESPGIMVDYGAGTGFFTEEIAKWAPDAHVYAIDIQEKMVRYLKEKMPENVRPVLVDSIQVPLEDNEADALWSIAVYHELENADLFLKEAFRILKPGGVILIIDWEKESPELSFGPPLSERIASRDLIEDIINSGFREITSIQEFNSHIAMRAVKPR